MSVREQAVQVTAGGWRARKSRKLKSFAKLLVCGRSSPVIAEAPENKPGEDEKQARVLEAFKIDKGGRYILLPIRIQEREYPFMLNTGSSLSQFDVSLRKFLGTPTHFHAVETGAEPVSVEFFNPPEAFLGKLDLHERGEIMCADLEAFRRATGREIRGVVGMSFLKNYVLRIDFDSGKVELRRGDTREHPEWGSAADLYDGGPRRKELVHAKGNLAGIGDINFFLDLGFNGAGHLETQAFERAMDKKALAEVLSTSFADTRRIKKTRIGHLALGGFEHRGLVMSEGN
jgi:hypothetical protein